MSDQHQVALDEWLSRLESLRPDDGRFTNEILKASGGFPLEDPATPTIPASTREEAEKRITQKSMATGFAKAYVSGAAKYRYQSAMAAAGDYRSRGDDEGIARCYARADYWESIGNWVDQLNV